MQYLSTLPGSRLRNSPPSSLFTPIIRFSALYVPAFNRFSGKSNDDRMTVSFNYISLYLTMLCFHRADDVQ